MSLQNVPVIGRLAGDPELSFSAAGKAIARFTIVTSGRKLDKAANEWIDVDTSWWRCTAFDQLAENICENLSKGEAVIGYGNASQDDWEDKEGGKRTNLKFIVNNLGADQRWRKRQVSGKDYQGEAPF